MEIGLIQSYKQINLEFFSLYFAGHFKTHLKWNVLHIDMINSDPHTLLILANNWQLLKYTKITVNKIDDSILKIQKHWTVLKCAYHASAMLSPILVDKDIWKETVGVELYKIDCKSITGNIQS